MTATAVWFCPKVILWPKKRFCTLPGVRLPKRPVINILKNLNYKLHNKSHQKIIHNYLFELEKEEVPHLRLEPQEIYKPVWVRLEDAIKKAFFANTKTLLEDVKRYYDKKETLK